jgi:Domain of unknown function (DUF5667)
MGAGKFSAGSGNRRQIEAELVNRLRQLPVGELPDRRFKAELRSQLVAIAPRIVAESGAEASTATVGQHRPSRLAVLRRPLLAFTGAAVVLVLLLSLAVWMAGGALPGQSLYGIKRASENFQLSVAGSDTGKATKYLKFAASRATESSKLAGAAQTDPHAALLIASALRNADADTRKAVRLLNDAAVSQVSAAPMAPLPSWLSQQRARIAALAPQLPAGPARSQATASLVLLQQAAVRVSQLKAELGCACLSQARSDVLGPLPCTSCLGKRPNAPGLPGLPGSGSSRLPSLPTGLPSSLSSAVPTSPSLPGLGGSGSAPLPTGASGLPTGLPSSLPSSPASVGTSGGSIGLPGVSISAGTGEISISISPTLP